MTDVELEERVTALEENIEAVNSKLNDYILNNHLFFSKAILSLSGVTTVLRVCLHCGIKSENFL